MKRNPERTAWIVLLTAFGSFCLLAVLCPASIYWYIMNATDPLPVELTSVRGIVLVDDAATEFSFSIMDGQTVPLNVTQSVATDNTSQAILTFTDDSSLTLYGDTSIVLQLAQEPRYGLSNHPTEIGVEVKKGRVRATASRGQADLWFNIQTPDADILLDQGSYSVEVNEDLTQVTTRLGQAEVNSGGETIILGQGERAVVGHNTPLSEPLPAAQNLLADSNFTKEFEDTWEVYQITPIESITTTAEVVNFQNQSVLNLRSEGEDNIHSEVGVIQMVNKDVRDFQSLRVFAEVRLLDQTLPGGGQLGSEFPIMLNVAYRDAEGNERDWFHGFYYEPPPENYILYNQPDNSSERIARFIWYPYESVNLLTTLGPTKPVYIRSIRIYASGWIYDSMVANISLLAEE
ncbi:MAG TPA: FecR domain-containing protein [Anaerolineae bacterium]|nr:FecR domain-containing protein [Anaerolineae bacterium]MCB0179025.1 FecR domain-containing protein [Anaerolineae bacterium]MCB9105866.1 FecR domain-containing protein [Anaerolineales bacterium]HRV94633.1 FecR domain-containing protein [Anaerolineae bacterium]